MFTLPTFFEDFLKEIRPTKEQQEEYKDAHIKLRERLSEFDQLQSVVVNDFLQGSYRRATAVRPKDGSKSDVDIVVVTNLDRHIVSPKQAMELFIPFLEEYYPGKWEQNDRSFSITLSSVKIDLVITAQPSESLQKFLSSSSMRDNYTIEEMTDAFIKTSNPSEWGALLLFIPDRNTETWQETNPLAQIEWTWIKNKECNGHYVNVVKALKWWRLSSDIQSKYPKGYPLEHLIGQCCPNGILSVSEGVTRTLEELVLNYESFVQSGLVPNLQDHGVTSHNVLARITPLEFKDFYEQAKVASNVARSALEESSKIEATKKWRELFGDEFPLASVDVNSSGGYTPRSSSSTIPTSRFA